MPDIVMRPEAFRAWMDEHAYSQREAAATLGIARETVKTYRREGAPRTVALACAAVAADLEPWRPDMTDIDPEDAVHADEQRRLAETEDAIDRGRDEERKRRIAELHRARPRRKLMGYE